MDDFKMTLEEMTSNLDGAAGRLLVASMRIPEVREAMEMITAVSLALGEIERIQYYSYSDDELKED